MDASSPFSLHFDTNYTPSDPEINEIKSIIQSHQVFVDDIERQIRELDDRRCLHSKIIEQHSALLSPIKRVPTDILSSIFLACLPRRQSSSRSMTLSKRHPAIIISHVCQQWYRVALESPLLWDRIHIAMPYAPHLRYTMRNRLTVTEAAGDLYKSELAQYEKKLQAIQDMALTWIARSANCPLDIAFSCEDTVFGRHFEDDFDDDSISEPVDSQFPQPTCINPILVDLILSVANRWKRSSFNLTISSWNSPLLRLLETPPTDVPQLEDLQLVLMLPQPFSEETRWEGLTPRVRLLKAPRLRALALSRLWVPSDQLPVNFGALTELYLGPYIDTHSTDHYAMTPSHALTVLKACRNLVRCFITLDSGSRFGAYTPGAHNNTASSTLLPLDEKITLPYLKSVSIQGSFLPPGFASSFDLPSLRTLFIICHSGTPQDEEGSGLADWVRNFGDVLTEVTFEHSTLTESALLYCLERLPNVETLRLVDTGMVMHGNWNGAADSPRSALLTDDILARLTPKLDMDESSLFYCPKLQNFSCRMTEIECTENGLLDFIAGRRQRTSIISPLERVVVKFNITQRMDIRKELVKRGVDLEGLSLVIKYNETLAVPFRSTSDKRLENLLPEDRMVAGDYWMPPGGTEWWH